MPSWTVIPISLLAALVGLLVMRRLMALFGGDGGRADLDMLHRAVHASGDGLLVAAIIAMVGLVALG